MEIIDSHVHIWTHNPEYPWAKEEPDIPVGNADPEDLIDLIKKSGVSRAVLVQYIKYRWDNRYVAQIMKDNPSLFWGVCRIDPENPASPDDLSYWTEIHGFQGVRISPKSDAIEDWFSGPLMLPLFKRAASLNVPVIILTKSDRLNDLSLILEKVPDVKVVIDHFADCLNQPDEYLERLLVLARYPGVFLKVGHIPQSSSEGYPWCDTHASLEKIFLKFGANRIMWGSDWPFCLKYMTYARSLALFLEGVDFITPEDREYVFNKTAHRIWH